MLEAVKFVVNACSARGSCSLASTSMVGGADSRRMMQTHPALHMRCTQVAPSLPQQSLRLKLHQGTCHDVEEDTRISRGVHHFSGRAAATYFAVICAAAICSGLCHSRLTNEAERTPVCGPLATEVASSHESWCIACSKLCKSTADGCPDSSPESCKPSDLPGRDRIDT